MESSHHVVQMGDEICGELGSILLPVMSDPVEVRKIIDQFTAAIIEALKKDDPSLISPVLNEIVFQIEKPQPTYFIELSNHINLVFLRIAVSELSAEECQLFLKDIYPILDYIHSVFFSDQLFNRSGIGASGVAGDSLDHLDKSKSDFISIAAHELKTPLTLLEGYSDMLREIILQKKIFDDHITLLLDGLDSGSRRLREIINDMIDVSLIENDLLALTFQPTWIFKIFDRIESELNNAAASRDITLIVNRFPGDDLLNFYDGERLYQAFLNIISNGVKFTPDGGTIRVNGRIIKEFIELVVVDNGIGIDPMDQAKIFEIFQQVGDSALHSSGKIKFKGGGPGLGLPIAKGIIEAHGGRIWVESEGYDEVSCPGSTFHILLPIRTEPPEKSLTLFFQRFNLDR